MDFKGGIPKDSVLAYPATGIKKTTLNARLALVEKSDDILDWYGEQIINAALPFVSLKKASIQLAINKLVNISVKKKFQLALDDKQALKQAEKFKTEMDRIRIGAEIEGTGPITNLKQAMVAIEAVNKNFIQGEQKTIVLETKQGEKKLKIKKEIIKEAIKSSDTSRYVSKLIPLHLVAPEVAGFVLLASGAYAATILIKHGVERAENALRAVSDMMRGRARIIGDKMSRIKDEIISADEEKGKGLGNLVGLIGGKMKSSVVSIGTWIAGHVGSVLAGLTVLALVDQIRDVFMEMIDAQDELAESFAGSGANWERYFDVSHEIGMMVGDLKMGSQITSSMASYGHEIVEATESLFPTMAKTAIVGLDISRDQQVTDIIATFSIKFGKSGVKVWDNLIYRLYDIKGAPLRRKALSILANRAALFGDNSEIWFERVATGVINLTRTLEQVGLRSGAIEKTVEEMSSYNPFTMQNKWAPIIESFGGRQASLDMVVGNYDTGLKAMSEFAKENQRFLIGGNAMGLEWLKHTYGLDQENIETLQALLKGDRESVAELMKPPKEKRKAEEEKLNEFFKERIGTERMEMNQIGLEWKSLFMKIAQEFISPFSIVLRSFFEAVKQIDSKQLVTVARSIANFSLWVVQSATEGAQLIAQYYVVKSRNETDKQRLLTILVDIEEKNARWKEKTELAENEDELSDEMAMRTSDLMTAKHLDTKITAREKKTIKGQFTGTQTASKTVPMAESVTHKKKTIGSRFMGAQTRPHAALITAPITVEQLIPDFDTSVLKIDSVVSVAGEHVNTIFGGVDAGIAAGFEPVASGRFSKDVAARSGEVLTAQKMFFGSSLWNDVARIFVEKSKGLGSSSAISLSSIVARVRMIFTPTQIAPIITCFGQNLHSRVDDFIKEAKDFKKSSTPSFVRPVVGAAQALWDGVSGSNFVMSLRLAIQRNVGRPYHLGAKERTGAIDCSGFVSQIITESLEMMSSSLPRSIGGAADLIRMSTEIGAGDLRPGDIIGITRAKPPGWATGRYRNISHIGIVFADERGALMVAHAGSKGTVANQTVQQWLSSQGVGTGGSSASFARPSAAKSIFAETGAVIKSVNASVVGIARHIGQTIGLLPTTDGGQITREQAIEEQVQARNRSKVAYYEKIADYAAGWFDNTEENNIHWKSHLQEERYNILRKDSKDKVNKILNSVAA